MRNCKYIITATEEEFNSFSEFLTKWVDNLDINEWQSLEDLVFSVAPIQDKIHKQLESKNKEYHIERKSRNSLSGIIDGEAEVVDSNSFSINEFLENDLCAVNGKRIVTQKNDEDYKANFILKFTKQMPKGKEKSLEEAEKEFERIQRGNDIIVDDAVMLHSFLTSSDLVSSKSSAINDFGSKFRSAQTSRFEGNSLLSDQLFNGLKYGYFKHISKKNNRVFKNLNLKSKLIGIDKDIIGHIDYITIDPNGRLHVYLYKVSSQNYNEWPSAKVEKFKAQLVFLKYILAENGFNVNNIELNIIPIHLKYNDDFSKVLSIRVDDPQRYSSKQSDGSYALSHYDQLVSRFLKDNYIPSEITNSDIKEATEDIKKIFPSLNIKVEGISKTAEEWIRTAPDCDPYDVESLVIRGVHEPNHGYDLIVRQKDNTTKTIVIKSDRIKNKNTELRDEVIKQLENLSDNKGYLLDTIKSVIQEGYNKGKTDPFSDQKGLPSTFLTSIFSKYFAHTTNDAGEKTYDWKMLDSLSEANIIMFQHNVTGQVDVISLSSFNLNVAPTLKEGATTVLGSYCYDTQTSVFKGDFGNIELIRTLTLLNKIAPSLGEGFKLGKVQVINTQSETQRAYSASYLNRSQFQEVLNVVNKENPDNKIKNNLNGCKFVDEVGVLLNEYLSITHSMTEAQAFQYASLGFDALQQASKDTREYALFNIMSNIYNIRPNFGRSEEIVINTARYGENEKDRNLAKLLILASQAYQAVRGETALHQSTLASLDTLTYTALNVPDINVRIVAENLQITHDTIASEFMEQFSPMNKLFENFFNDVGYTQLKGVTIGDEARQFSNLYDPDDELFKFKNPYDNSNDLTPTERELLKKVLFSIAKIRTHDNFQFESHNSPELVKWIKENPYYLWVPLERASKATTRQTLNGIKSAMKYTKKLLTNSKDRFEDTVEGLLSEEAEELDKGFKSMQLNNLFSLSIPSGSSSVSKTEKSRRKLLERGRDFYETNLKNILVDYLFRSIATDQYNKLLISSKALLLSMHLTSDMGGNEEALRKEIDHIKDYLKVNVFQRSIMEPKSKKVISFIQPIKSRITNMLLMGNVVSFMRDSIQGVLENTTRSIIKLNTNISPKSLTKAYAYVTTHSTSNARAVNLLSKLCLRYRLSNTDVARIAERAKSARDGIFNLDNKLYGTLRSPDFLNRMTLFVAKCIEDGCWDAWYLDNNGDLKYEWRKDSRFSLLASEDNSNPEEYAKQRSMYFSKIRQYNLDHPEREPLDISLSTDLPAPYSNKEILSIRSVADNIYGSYDKSKKAMYENWALGVSFGMFTTWFNGIYNNYFAKAGQYATSKLKQVQDTDPETGQLLYFDVNTGEITVDPTSNDGTPNDIVWKDVPIITQGIFPTIGTLYHVFKNDGKDGLIKYLKSNEGERANLRKLISDLLMTGLFLLLFKAALDADWYKEQKKEMKNNSLIQNLITEILYKSSSRAYDSFMGPINIIQQLGDNMNPPYYSAPLKLLQDTYSTIFGEKQFVTLMTDNLGIARAFKDTYKAELKKNQ